MSFFMLLFWLELGSRFRSRRFLAGASVVLALTLAVALLLPEPAPVGLTVGLVNEWGEAGEETVRLLCGNQSVSFQRAADQEELERGILTGRFHCGYLLEEDGTVTALTSEGSYLRPVLDEVVFSQVQRAELDGIVAAFLERKGLSAEGIWIDDSIGMEIVLKTEGAAPEDALLEYAGSGAQPLLYAVLITAAFAAAALAAPQERRDDRARFLLAGTSGRVWQTRTAPILARAVCVLVVFFAADLVFHQIVRYSVYSLSARWTMFCLLAVLSAAAGAAAARLMRGRSVLYCVLPALLIGSVLLSGAVVDPAFLPPPLSALRFLTPSWWLLRLMSALS